MRALALILFASTAGASGRTLYFASDRVLPVKFPRARGATTPAWDNGLYNIWSIDLAPWLAR